MYPMFTFSFFFSMRKIPAERITHSELLVSIVKADGIYFHFFLTLQRERMFVTSCLLPLLMKPFQSRTTLKGKNLLLEGAHSFL